MTPEADDDHGLNGAGVVSDEDVRAMLAQERAKSTKLQRDLEAERTGRTRAEATASSHATARFDAEQAAVKQRLDSAEATALTLRKQYAEALAEGRFDEVAELQDKMGELRATQAQDKQYQSWLAGEKARAAANPQPPAADQPVDLSVYTEAQRKWIKKHPDFMVDESLRKKTFAGHQLAMAEGIEMDTPEYFEIIDDMVSRGRKRRTEAAPEDDDSPYSDTGQPERQAAERQERQPAEIPVSRSGPRQQERERAVRLSADEMEAADITNPDIPVQGRRDAGGNWIPGRYERYAIQRAKLRARGQ